MLRNKIVAQHECSVPGLSSIVNRRPSDLEVGKLSVTHSSPYESNSSMVFDLSKMIVFAAQNVQYPPESRSVKTNSWRAPPAGSVDLRSASSPPYRDFEIYFTCEINNIAIRRPENRTREPYTISGGFDSPARGPEI